MHYTSKGAETHLTGVPRAAFADLSPASFLVMARFGEGEQTVFRCLTVDSASDAAVMLVDALELGPDFLIDERQPPEYRKRERERFPDICRAVTAAWLAGTIATFAIEKTAMPETIALADQARSRGSKKHERKSLSPFEIDAPGDALREISRSIEWDLFREYQLRERAVGLVRSLSLGMCPGNRRSTPLFMLWSTGCPRLTATCFQPASSARRVPAFRSSITSRRCLSTETCRLQSRS